MPRLPLCPFRRFPSLLSPATSTTSLNPSSLSPLFLLPSRSYERLPRRAPPRHSHAHFQALAQQRRLTPPTPSQPPSSFRTNPSTTPTSSAPSPPHSPPSPTPSPTTPSLPPPLFSIVELNGAQHKVVHDDLIMSDRLPLDIGQRVRLTNVLLMGTVDHTLIGRPLVEGAWVECEVEEQARTAKVLVFHKKRRKNHRKMRGHRDDVTLLRVTRINAPDTLPLPPAPPMLTAVEGVAA